MKRAVFVRYFLWPVVTSALIFIAILWGYGLHAFALVAILSVLEITLSFDNAVVNASVLKRMSTVWQERFLTWGILLAVFGTRFVLPILIVSVAAWASPVFITLLSFSDPAEYGRMLDDVHGSISAFGGVFLLMVSLKYFINQAKSVHWIQSIERHLARWGAIEAVEIAIALTVLLFISFVSHTDQASILVAGLVGVILFILMEGVDNSMSIQTEQVATGGFALFMYLNVLDSAFSLDGVVGAFALTNNLILIMAGLGIGAYFVRSMTLYLVREGTLSELIYLEHGAHWAILGLATAMFANLIVHVPEVITGCIGLAFIIFSYYSSKKQLQNHGNPLR